VRRKSLNFVQIGTLLILVLALGYLAWVGYGALPKPEPTPTPEPVLVFEGSAALVLAEAQCDFGPRPTGSPAGWSTGDWIIEQLETAGWQVETDEFDWNGAPVRNIIAKAGEGTPILVGAHYDTRMIADQDPDPTLRGVPILGGNDGASGVAVLLELARVLDVNDLPNQVWLTFFDAEDNGQIEGWDWALGSTHLAENLETLPAAMILADMVGDADQSLPYEINSHPLLREQLWNLAADLGYGDTFIPEPGPALTDDHLPFARRGVPAVDIIDFDYPFWHTTSDTCGKLSAESLERVGRLLEAYLEQGKLQEILPQL
jgi:hypothetical protein